MNYILKSSHEYNFREDVISMLLMFYPNEKFNVVDKPVSDGVTVSVDFDGSCCTCTVFEDGKAAAFSKTEARNDSIRELKRCLKTSIYKAAGSVTRIKLPWGILTGVRPAKLVSMLHDEGCTDAEIRDILSSKYLVRNDKIDLMTRVAAEERKIVENGAGTSALYIGIPFCPTRCLYCSFTSYPLDRYCTKVDAYIDALEKEMSFTSRFFEGRELESIYIGGGTPTSLNEIQLDRLLSCVDKYFDRSRLKEYTVEAGRPDTITREKLRIIKAHGADRISVNPQTLNDKTLDIIGRQHTTDMFFNAFYMAREEGYSHINTDIILGLPGEGEREVIHTMEGLKALNPESITVHTLAVKRASRLKETLERYDMPDFDQMEKMLDISARYTAYMGMQPYYMYRQKNMVGNFENVGYCKPGCRGVYNVQIMEEKQTVAALGAGASTKIVDSEKNRIDRIFNVKSVDDYINRIDEMIDRKRGYTKWQ